MMGLSSMGSGGGGGNSSTSNLSASAPPFTVDRLNPKPNSSPLLPNTSSLLPNTSPLLHYSDLPYVVEPLSHTSQYAHLSVPRVEPAIDSNEIISVPVSDSYRFSASASASPSGSRWSAHSSAFGGDVKPPYYNPYVPPLVGGENMLAEDKGSRYNVALTSGLGVTSQHEYTPSLFDLEYGPQWADSLAFDDGKQAKGLEFDGNFSSRKQYVGSSHAFENQPYRGGSGCENRNQFKEDSGVLYKNLIQVSDREVYTGPSSNGYMEDKSCLEHHLGFFHYDSSKTLLTASSSPYPDPYSSVVSCAMQKDFPNYQNSINPYEKCDRPVDAPFPGRVSVARSSPTVVIRPPPATNWNSGQGGASLKPAGVHVVNSDYTNPSKPNGTGLKPNPKPEGDAFETTVLIRPPPAVVNWNFRQGAASRKPAGVHIVDSDYTNPSKPNDSGLKPNSKPEGDSSETSFFKSSMQWSSHDSSISVKESSIPLHSKDTSDCKIEAPLGSQMPEVNVLRCFTSTGGNIQMVNATAESSDLLDHHNTAVDSPCWRGAPSSQFSMFDIEAGNSNHVEMNLDEHGLGHGEHQSLISTIDSNRVLSEEVECNMGNENECGKPCETFCREEALDAMRSNMMTELNKLSSVFDTKVSDAKTLFGEDGFGTTVIDVSEGAAIAVHAAEKVLASPASQENASEQTTVPDLGLDVPSIVKTLHSLSELLRYHISSDVCSLGEENTETLKHVISSLSSCLSKKGIQAQAASNPEPKGPVGKTSGIVGDSSSMGIISRDLRTSSDSPNSCTKPDYLHFQKGEMSFIFTGKKDEISPIILPLRDDLHITGDDDDDMAKAIKKVLEQNLHINEDMHPQALLFKSLWLESEAKLCSISYKARFERMKIQMEEMTLKALKANEDNAEMTSDHCMSPDPINMSERPPEARGGTLPKPTSPNSCTSGMNWHADGIEASVLARFNILKCREENSKPLNTEEQQRSVMVAGKHADTVMARFNILKSREENPKPLNSEEQQRSVMVAGNHADMVVARFNVLKSREENSKPINMDEEKPPQVVNDEFASVRTSIRSQSEDEALDVALQPESQCATGCLPGGKFTSYFDGAVYELSPAHSRAINENNSRWRESSSEWEHVLKEDFSWKN